MYTHIYLTYVDYYQYGQAPGTLQDYNQISEYGTDYSVLAEQESVIGSDYGEDYQGKRKKKKCPKGTKKTCKTWCRRRRCKRSCSCVGRSGPWKEGKIYVQDYPNALEEQQPVIGSDYAEDYGMMQGKI